VTEAVATKETLNELPMRNVVLFMLEQEGYTLPGITAELARLGFDVKKSRVLSALLELKKQKLVKRRKQRAKWGLTIQGLLQVLRLKRSKPQWIKELETRLQKE
jgi:hypothetical protein